MSPPPTPDHAAAPPRFRVADLEVDIGKAEVTRGDEKIALPKLSFDLLCALIKAAPAIVTNEELLKQVWPGLQVSPESVAQRVKLLRSAIGDDSQQPRYILGVRGRGYRLIPAVERLAIAGRPMRDAVNPSVAASVTIADKSIAVLPFTDMSEKRDQEYFADGMAEEILNLLAKIPGLKVIGRTSSFQFKGKSEDLRTIGAQLGVAYVLEGSVRKSGDRLRVTAQLIDSTDGTRLFSKTYDRGLIDVLKMQDEIAASLVRSLQIEVGADGPIYRPALPNPEAYTLLLRGRHGFDRLDQQGLEQAVSDFQRALDLDPSCAAAADGLAGAYFILYQWGFMPPADALEASRHAAERALDLDPKLAVAHARLSEVYRAYWNWPAAARELKMARDLAPNDAVILLISAVFSKNMGRLDDALRFINASLLQDPLAPGSYMVLSYIQLGRGRLEEAEVAIRRTMEISPTLIPAHHILGNVLIARSQPEAALAEMLKEKDDGGRLSGSAMALFALGRRSDSDAALAQMVKTQTDLHPFKIARVYAFRGQADEAFQWLDRAYAQKHADLWLIKNQKILKNILGDPRYKAFLKKMNLPEG